MADPDLTDSLAPRGYTQAQGEMMRLQFFSRKRIEDRTLPAQRLVEFRCRGTKGSGGHLLAVIYNSPSGPLAVSTANVPHTPEEMAEYRRHGQALIEEFGDQRWNPKRPNWDPNPRLVEFDEAFADKPMPINCRFGRSPDLLRPHLFVSRVRPYWPDGEERTRKGGYFLGPMKNDAGQYLSAVADQAIPHRNPFRHLGSGVPARDCYRDLGIAVSENGVLWICETLVPPHLRSSALFLPGPKLDRS